MNLNSRKVLKRKDATVSALKYAELIVNVLYFDNFKTSSTKRTASSEIERPKNKLVLFVRTV